MKEVDKKDFLILGINKSEIYFKITSNTYKFYDFYVLNLKVKI